MGIQVVWDDEARTTIRFVFEAEWTWQDFDRAIEASRALRPDPTQRFAIIADFSHGAPPPMGALTRFKAAWDLVPYTLVAIAIVGGDAFIETLLHAFTRLYRRLAGRMVYAETLAAARQLLAAYFED